MILNKNYPFIDLYSGHTNYYISHGKRKNGRFIIGHRYIVHQKRIYATRSHNSMHKKRIKLQNVQWFSSKSKRTCQTMPVIVINRYAFIHPNAFGGNVYLRSICFAPCFFEELSLKRFENKNVSSVQMMDYIRTFLFRYGNNIVLHHVFQQFLKRQAYSKQSRKYFFGLFPMADLIAIFD